MSVTFIIWLFKEKYITLAYYRLTDAPYGVPFEVSQTKMTDVMPMPYAIVINNPSQTIGQAWMLPHVLHEIRPSLARTYLMLKIVK